MSEKRKIEQELRVAMQKYVNLFMIVYCSYKKCKCRNGSSALELHAVCHGSCSPLVKRVELVA